MALLPLDFVNIPLLSFDIHCFFASFLKKERTKTSRRISLIVIICYSSLYYQITFFFLPSLKNNLVVLQYVCMCVCSVTSVVSDYLRPYRLQPAWLLCSWASPGNNTRVGCHFLLQENLPDPEIEPASLVSPSLAGRLFTSEPPGNAHILIISKLY